MDVARPSNARKKLIRRVLFGVGGIALLALVTVGLARLEPAPPSVDRSMVWVDQVKRGSLRREVRGSGTLVPEAIQWIPASSEGRVERILTLPGTVVTPDTVLIELSNPDLELAALDAEAQLREGEANLASLRVTLQSQLLTQQAGAAAIQSEYRQATLQAEADRELAQDGLIADLTMKLSKLRAEELAKRAGFEEKRLAIATESFDAQLEAQSSMVRRLSATASHRRRQLEDLLVRPRSAGVLQQVPVEVGQQVSLGTNLARVAEPGRLKAEIRIPETQARDVQIGQSATVDTRNGVIEGRVTRIDPAVQNGTVTIDVALISELPRGARPDLTVDGTVQLEQLDDVLYVGRPAFGQEQSQVGLFRLEDEGGVAIRRQVQLGRASVTAMEIVGGLNEGDEIILSDMSRWDDFDRVRLN